MSTQSGKTREQLEVLLERGEISRETFAEYSATADTAVSSAPRIDGQTHNTAPTQFLEADGIRFAYRRFGKQNGMPLVFNQHYTGTMDHWDPAVTDGFAKDREVILFNNAGVSSTSGERGRFHQSAGTRECRRARLLDRRLCRPGNHIEGA